MPHELNLKSQVRFHTMTVPHEVQLPLYYLHFEIAQLNRLIQDKFDIPLNFELKKGQGYLAARFKIGLMKHERKQASI